METKMPLTADALDILFLNRNKAYGAYALRRTYSKRVTYALLTTILLATTFLLIHWAMNAFAKRNTQCLTSVDVVLDNYQEEKKLIKQELPKPQKKQSAPPEVATIKSTTPLIVIDKLVLDPPPEIDSLNTNMISDANRTGVHTDIDLPPANPHPQDGTQAVATPSAPEDDGKTIFESVQVEAAFPGGKAAWVKFLEKNLNNQLPADNGAPEGKYTVFVSFVVDKHGAISNIAIENDPHYGTAEEAIRVIKKGPLWTPAIQNGRFVNYRVRQAITFVVND